MKTGSSSDDEVLSAALWCTLISMPIVFALITVLMLAIGRDLAEATAIASVPALFASPFAGGVAAVAVVHHRHPEVG